MKTKKQRRIDAENAEGNSSLPTGQLPPGVGSPDMRAGMLELEQINQKADASATTEMTDMAAIKIDFVSDIACPWCAVGLSALESAIDRLKDEVQVDLHFQPFQLNPDMPPEGEDIVEHLSKKYRLTPQQVASNQENIRIRGEEVGFTFNMDGRKRTYNTFDSHRLLHWAEVEGQDNQQHLLKKTLLEAYFTEGLDPSSHAVLIGAVKKSGMDEERAAAILAGDTFTAEVRERQQHYLSQGIHSVPSIIFNDKHLLQGGQPVEMFENAIRQIAGI